MAAARRTASRLGLVGGWTPSAVESMLLIQCLLRGSVLDSTVLIMVRYCLVPGRKSGRGNGQQQAGDDESRRSKDPANGTACQPSHRL